MATALGTSLASVASSILAQFGSTGYLLSEQQSASGSVPGNPNIVTTQQAVTYVVDTSFRKDDNNNEQRPDEKTVLIAAKGLTVIPSTDDFFTNASGQQHQITKVDIIEVQSVAVAYTLTVKGTQ